MTVPLETADASSPADTPTWEDIAATAMWRSGTADCGCPRHRHNRDQADDYLGGGAPATLHEPGRCIGGRHDAELDPRLARHIAIPVPEGAATVTVDRATLAGALRGIPADGALDQVAAERSAERAYAEAGIERIEQRLALAAELEATIARLAEGGFATGDLAARVARLRGGRPTAAPADAVPPTAVPFTVPPAPGAVPPAAAAPTAPPAVDLAEQELLRAAAAAASDPSDVYAHSVVERADEQAQLTIDLSAYLAHVPDLEARGREISALMAMTLAERSEAVEAAKAGRLHRLGLRLADLVPSAKGSTRAWLRLREGAAGKWSIEELVPFTKEQLRAKMNGSPRVPTIMQLFYGTSIHLLAGSGGIGKTRIALAACKAVIPAVPVPGHRGPYAVYLDLDQNGDELYQRAGWLGVREEDLLSRRLELMDVSAEAAERGAGTVALLRSILEGLLEAPPKVVVVDSLTRITSDIGADSDNGDAITAVLGMFNDLARVSCVIVLDHTGHGDQTRPKGSGAKKDASHVVHSVEAISLDPERNPHAVAVGKIHSTKDRFGGIRRINRDPGDRSSLPVLGMISVAFDDSVNAASVDFAPQRVIAEASARRESDEGQTFASEARKVIRRLVDAAARNAVTAEQAKARGCKPVPPLSARGAEDAAWEELRDNKLGGRKSDVREAIRRMTGKDLVEYQANWGSTPGVRLRVAGGISGGGLDPVDLD